MDLLRTLLVYMSVLVSSAGINSPALTPVPQDVVTPAPTVLATQTPIPTAVATVSPTPALSTLSMNSRGEEVRRMQQRLIDLGYLRGRADGIFGKQTLSAVERFQRANQLSTDGIAGPKTLNKLYFDPNVVWATDAPPTSAPISATLTVSYVSTTGATFNTDTIALAQGSHTITPNAAKVPRGYILRSQRSVTVRVDNRGVASPASITYTYQAPALAPTVNVPIFYRSDTNQLLSQDYVSAPFGQTVTVYAQQNRVPQGFALLTPAQLSVAVSPQGVPTPSFLTFVYRGPQVVTALVPVFYRNAQGDLLASHMMSLQAGTHTVVANDALVPQGYTLQGAREQRVTVSSGGTANPTAVTFTYRTSAVTVSLPVHYVDPNGAMLHQDSVSVMTGPNTVTADDALVPGYQLVSARQVSVQVDSDGKANPDKVVFTYKKPATATVSVQYRDTAGKSLLDTSVTFSEGNHTVIANDSFVPAGYTLQSAREVPVTVRADGTVTPALITFTYQAPATPPPATATPTPATPTPAPATPTPAPVAVQVTLNYVNQAGELIGAESIPLTGVGVHQVVAPTTQIGDYRITDNTPRLVEVRADGTAAPSALSFLFTQPDSPAPVTATPTATQTVTPATPPPTPEPTAEPTVEPTVEPTAEPTAEPTVDPATIQAKVTLRYTDPVGEIRGEEVMTLTGVGQHAVTAQTDQLGDYLLVDTEPVAVTVTADGIASPAEISFIFAKPATPIPDPTTVPAPEPTAESTEEPTAEPTAEPTPEPTAEPTEEPTPEPTAPPSVAVLPAFQEVEIPAEDYPMYAGPSDTSYISTTENQVFTGGPARLWGSENGWVMIGHALDGQGNYRVGYIQQSLLPAEWDIPEMQFQTVSLPLMAAANLREDPFGHNLMPDLPIQLGTNLTVLGAIEDYAYVEWPNMMLRGFVPKAALGIQ